VAGAALAWTTLRPSPGSTAASTLLTSGTDPIGGQWQLLSQTAPDGTSSVSFTADSATFDDVSAMTPPSGDARFGGIAVNTSNQASKPTAIVGRVANDANRVAVSFDGSHPPIDATLVPLPDGLQGQLFFVFVSQPETQAIGSLTAYSGERVLASRDDVVCRITTDISPDGHTVTYCNRVAIDVSPTADHNDYGGASIGTVNGTPVSTPSP
jgi:hypothetical protein